MLRGQKLSVVFILRTKIALLHRTLFSVTLGVSRHLCHLHSVSPNYQPYVNAETPKSSLQIAAYHRPPRIWPPSHANLKTTSPASKHPKNPHFGPNFRSRRPFLTPKTPVILVKMAPKVVKNMGFPRCVQICQNPLRTLD